MLEQLVRDLIKVAAASSQYFQFPVRAFCPRADLTNEPLLLRPLEIRSSFNRIGDGGEKDIRLGGAHMLDGGLDIFHLLSLVTPHQEHASLNPIVPAKLCGPLHLLDGYSALHAVENALGAALR